MYAAVTLLFNISYKSVQKKDIINPQSDSCCKCWEIGGQNNNKHKHTTNHWTDTQNQMLKKDVFLRDLTYTVLCSVSYPEASEQSLNQLSALNITSQKSIEVSELQLLFFSSF